MQGIAPLYAPETTRAEASAAGWTKVGEIADGSPVYEADFEEKVGEEPVLVGGEPQWVMAGAERVKPKMRAVMQTIRRRFVEVRQPNGGKFLNFGFQPDPEELARLERRQKIADMQSALAEKMVDGDLSVDQLINVLKGAGSAPKRGKAD
jgi:hypothetical protein